MQVWVRPVVSVHRPATPPVLRMLAQGLVLGLALCLAVACTAPADNPAGVTVRQSADPSGFRGAFLAEPYTMPDQTLDDTAGHAYNLRHSPSKPVTLIFFGYTNCPDVCIGVLASMANSLQGLDPAVRDQIQMVFITTDPARDDGPAIRKYLDRFDPSFIGLTGDLKTIRTIAGRVGVDVQGIKKLPSGGYEVGHSAQVIGFGKDNLAHVVWTPSTPVGDLEHDFQLLVDEQQ